MDYFIIGDIHGCFFTFSAILKHWNTGKEYLVSVGDLIDRGNYSALVVEECMKLSAMYENTIFLKGNHEAEMITYMLSGHNKYWTDQGGYQTLENFKSNQSDLNKVVSWLQNMPLTFGNESIMVTHAGISATEAPFEESNFDGVLWNRLPLKNLDKIQIHGHTPLKARKPEFNEDSQSWNIDTGAAYGYGLTALRLSASGKLIEIVHIETDQRDLQL